jgi:hypothetical protein
MVVVTPIGNRTRKSIVRFHRGGRGSLLSTERKRPRCLLGLIIWMGVVAPKKVTEQESPLFDSIRHQCQLRKSHFTSFEEDWVCVCDSSLMVFTNEELVRQRQTITCLWIFGIHDKVKYSSNSLISHFVESVMRVEMEASLYVYTMCVNIFKDWLKFLHRPNCKKVRAELLTLYWEHLYWEKDASCSCTTCFIDVSSSQSRWACFCK